MEQNFEADLGGEQEDEATIYDITTSPNDFNTTTLVNMLESGIIKVPFFQRNYVWDIKRASKFIESLLLGLPIPQIFLFEKQKNSFLIIDGQQRLFTIYFFKKGRFPKNEHRSELRTFFYEGKGISDKILQDDEYFSDFSLKLPVPKGENENPFNKKKYDTLDSPSFDFDFKVIRSIIIKQNSPDDGDTAMFEIFNRLNTGGINLKPQEIRMSLYDSNFCHLILDLNNEKIWRNITSEKADLNLRDVEIILRGFSFLFNREKFKSSLNSFLNVFSKEAQNFDQETNDFVKNLFLKFLEKINPISQEKIFSKRNGRFSSPLFEAVFYAMAKPCIEKKDVSQMRKIDQSIIDTIYDDSFFKETLSFGSYKKESVDKRLNIAEKYVEEFNR